MERRGHALPGMDAVYTDVTHDMRQRLCDVLEDVWRTALAERRAISARSNVPLLDRVLNEKEAQRESDLARQTSSQSQERVSRPEQARRKLVLSGEHENGCCARSWPLDLALRRILEYRAPS